MTLIDLGLLCLFPIFFILLRTFDRKKWIGLTDEEIKEIHNLSFGKNIAVATGLTEAKLKEKNETSSKN